MLAGVIRALPERRRSISSLLFGGDFQRRVKGRDPLFDGLALGLGGWRGGRFGGATVSAARAGLSGLASIVAPSSAAIATERAKGAGLAIEWMKDDMVGSPFWCPQRVVTSPLRRSRAAK